MRSKTYKLAKLDGVSESNLQVEWARWDKSHRHQIPAGPANQDRPDQVDETEQDGHDE